MVNLLQEPLRLSRLAVSTRVNTTWFPLLQYFMPRHWRGGHTCFWLGTTGRALGRRTCQSTPPFLLFTLSILSAALLRVLWFLLELRWNVALAPAVAPVVAVDFADNDPSPTIPFDWVSSSPAFGPAAATVVAVTTASALASKAVACTWVTQTEQERSGQVDQEKNGFESRVPTR